MIRGLRFACSSRRIRGCDQSSAASGGMRKHRNEVRDTVMSTTQSHIIPSGRARSANRVSVAVGIAVIGLVVLALLGTNVAVLALLALGVLGSLLILFDRSLRIESHEIHM